MNTVDLENNNTAIGCWYTPKEFIDIAKTSGWKVQEIPFDKGHYQSFYRFNILLSR